MDFARWIVPAVLLLAVGGCADMEYDRLKIGQSVSEYERVLPESISRTTSLGRCCLRSDAQRTDATVALVSDDRRLYGKLQATSIDRNWLLGRERGFRLRGEIDVRLARMRGAGPIDALRAIAGDLTGYRGERVAMDAHAWVAAGIVRVLQRWPNVSDVGVDPGQLAELLERVPAGGRTDYTVDERGVLIFEYRHGSAP